MRPLGECVLNPVMSTMKMVHKQKHIFNLTQLTVLPDQVTNPIRDASPPLRPPMKVHFRLAVHCFVFTSSFKDYSH